MLKKAMPLFLLSGLVLGGCINNSAMPGDTDRNTPMENVEDRTRDWAPKVRDEHRGGRDLDGIDEQPNLNEDGVRNGVINEDNGVGNGKMNGRNAIDDILIDEGAPNDVIIDDQNRTRNSR